MRKFTRGLFLSGLATSVAVYFLAVRPRLLRWGATDEESRSHLPGDDLLPQPRLLATHAVTIQAPPERIWPWLVQIGQDRAGFYTYDWIENLMGLDIHSVSQVRPEWQNLQVGDLVNLAPGGFGIPVARLEPNQALVLHGDSRLGMEGALPGLRPGDWLAVSWGLYLRRQPDGSTRLLERWKADWNPNLLNTLAYNGFMEVGAFIMEHGMLQGIRQRAEGL